MHIFNDLIAYFQADPGRIFGWPFLLLAVSLNVWLVYDAIRRRRIAREIAAGRNTARTLELALKDALRYAALGAAINELREKAGLPPINFSDDQTVQKLSAPR